jgi:hypothetical protein
MDKCQVKKGIFVLSTCDSPSVTNCDECSIPICTNHSQYSGPKVLCPECFNKANPEMFNPKAKVKKQLDDDYYSNYNIWYYSTRSYFYNSYNYRPFNEDDYRVFDKKDDMDLIDDKDSGSFFDS